MSRRSYNSGKTWTEEEVEVLRKLAKKNISLLTISRALGRTIRAIKSKASEEDIELQMGKTRKDWNANRSRHNKKGKDDGTNSGGPRIR
ncbi:MAG: hypothetical protein K9J12_06830 [Melioribacteraceae bacterium]|nr:hypothetical protein [Melioribacteraceae bacterium]